MFSDHRPYSLAILLGATVLYGMFAIRQWREGEIATAVGLTFAAAAFVVYAVAILVFGGRTSVSGGKRRKAPISPRRFGGRVELIRSTDATEVELARARLEAAGIEVILTGSENVAVLPVLGDQATVQLAVQPADVERAVELLDEAFAGAAFATSYRPEVGEDRHVGTREEDENED